MIKPESFKAIYADIKKAKSAPSLISFEESILDYVSEINPKDRLFHGIYDKMEELKNNYRDVFDCDYGNRQLWFRGQQDGGNALLPPLLWEGKKGTLTNAIKGRMRDFRYMAASTGESEQADRSNADCLAMMQHYGAGTNLLGFTENVQEALFCAFRKYMEFLENGRMSDSKTHLPALYIFCPELYNYALSQLAGDFSEDYYKDHSKEMALYQLMRSFKDQESLPYLSGFGMEIPFTLFLGEEKEPLSGFRSTALTIEKFPVAVHIAQPHSPVRTLANCFLAYNCYVEYPSKKEKISIDGVRLENLSLEEIQRLYLSKRGNNKPFLYKLWLTIESPEDGIFSAKQLEIFGNIRKKEDVTLEQVGKRVAERYRKIEKV